MSVLYGITCVMGIIFMSVFVFIGIWLFIVALKAFRQLKYKNFILEKIYQKLDSLSHNNNHIENLDESSLDFFDLNEVNNLDLKYDNVKNFDSNIEKTK